jgi:hypothetical protein
MRSTLVLLVVVGSAGCFSPSYRDGELHCAAAVSPACPDSFHCAVDSRCWRDGHDPPRPPAHLTTAGGGDPHLADGNYQLGLSVGQPFGGTARSANANDHVLQLGVLRDAVSQ